MKIKDENICLKGEIEVPGDKSISHRAIILGSISEGRTIVENCLMSDDTLRTIDCFRKLGTNIEIDDGNVIIEGVGLKGFKEPKESLFCGNSGTTLRLISGILVGQNFATVLEGDSSLNNRPMDRIIKPLRKMGADIEGVNDQYPPLLIKSVEKLKGIFYELPVASAQVKSALLLASLYCNEDTTIIEKSTSRDHTEKMLKFFGGNIKREDNRIINSPVSNLKGKRIYVPGDISSAFYFIVGALILENSEIVVRNVGVNETRTGLLQVLKQMGANIEIKNMREVNNEPIADIYAKYSKLKGIEIKGDIIGKLIDEIPILAVAATKAHGTTIIKDAEELKYKESNRIKAMANELQKMGAYVEELEDGLRIEGKKELVGANLNSYDDHRILMALSIAALSAKGETSFHSVDCVKVSFPNFFDTMKILVL